MDSSKPIRIEHAAILTEDPSNPHADTMVIDGERIAWVGWADELPQTYAGDACETVDMDGARVIPGFIDAHMHAVMLADYSRQISALPPAINSIAELIEAIREQRAHQDADTWIHGWGYDEALLAEGRSPNRYDLDAASDGAPVCMMRTCGHIRCVNSRALEIAGITRDTPDPEGGQIERDEHGEPTGVLKETARDLVTPFIPRASEQDTVAGLVDLGRLLSSQGIVAATDMCTLDGTDAQPLLAKAAEAGLAQDMATYVLWDYVKDDPTYAIAPKLQDRSRQLFCAGIKLLTDGSVSGKTAWFDTPYLGSDPADADACGFPTCTEEELDDAIAFCEANRCQLSLHAMGTRAIDRVLDHAAGHAPWCDGTYPHVRIEHVTAPSPRAIRTLVDTGIGVVTQPIFAYAEIGTYLANLGIDRTRTCYPFRTMLDAGVNLCISTDAPATSWAVPSDPFPNIKSAVTRHAYNGVDFGQDERLSIEEAIALYTREAARMVGFEGLGMLRAGYKASFAVLDRDILAVPADELDRVQVVCTYIRGKKAFER